MRLALLLICALTACAEFPALDENISDAARQAPYPQLQPLPDSTVGPPVTSDTLDDRVAALQARAARLRQIDIAALQ